MQKVLMKISGIYQIGSKLDKNKIYIGSSVDLDKRKLSHFLKLRRNRHENKFLQDWFNNYGINDTEFRILEECSIDRLLYNEQRYIDLLYPEFNIQRVAKRKGEGCNKDDSCKFSALNDMNIHERNLMYYAIQLLKKYDSMEKISEYISDDYFPNLDFKNKDINIISPAYNDEKEIRKILLEDIKIKYNLNNKSYFSLVHKTKIDNISNNILRELLLFGNHKYLLKYKYPKCYLMKKVI